MNGDTPFFSILVPSYNRPDELRRCLDSILQSDFLGFEIIVSDDNSPRQAEVAEVVSSFESDKIRFFKQPLNLREPDNKNFLVKQAAGKFNIVLGDDDTLCKRSLHLLYEHISRNPVSDIYGFGYNIVDEGGNLLSTYASTKTVLLNKTRSRLLVVEAGLLPMTLFHPATFCCKAGLEIDLPYRNDVGIGEDLCFLIQAVLNNHSIQIVPEALFNWRKVQDVDSVSQGNQSAQFLASFESKRRIHGFLLSESTNEDQIHKHISSIRFRFNFMYSELMRLDSLKPSDLSQHMDDEMIAEFLILQKSTFWKFNYFLIRPLRFFHLCSLVGVLDAFKILWTRFFPATGP